MHHDLCVWIEEPDSVNGINWKCRQEKKAREYQEYLDEPKIEVALM